MNCCINCFRDTHIRRIIENSNQAGDCDFCKTKNTIIFNVDDSSNPITEKVIGLIQIYAISDNIDAKPINKALYDDWDVFAIDSDIILSLVKMLCDAYYKCDADIFTKNVIIEQLTDKDFLREYGVVSGNSWDEFADSIKYGNRFHSGMFNSEQFASFLSIVKNVYPVNTVMYRARLSPDKHGFTKDEMQAPPKDKRTAGRINPEGIGVLYLSSDKATTLNEIRANAFDHVTIGEFYAKRDINVVNLSGFDKTSPFDYVNELEGFAANRKVFKEIAAEIAKPLRRSDSALEYLPTQYVAEFIKAQNYDGVAYDSTLRQGGYNLAIFCVDDNIFECKGVETVEVAEILYRTQPKI